MNKFCILLVFVISAGIALAYSPDPTWLKRITHEAGLDSCRGGRIWVADVNNDNYPDLFWGEGGINKNHLHLYLNVPNPDKTSLVKRIFVNWTDSSGINVNRDPMKTGRVVDIMAAADLNNDGNIDIVTSIYYHRLQYYQNGQDPGDRTEVMLGDGKGHFTLNLDARTNIINMNDTLPLGLINATGMAYLDADYDGILDLYISTWFTDYAAFNGLGTPMPDVFLKGNGDGSFQRIMNSGMQNVIEPEYGVNATDYDNDGYQDIITSPYCRSGGALFRNLKEGKFVNFTDFANYSAQKMNGDHGQALCQWSAQPGDFDNDGDMDLRQVEVHGGYNEGEGRTHISVNGGPNNGYAYQWDMTRIVRDAPLESHLGDQGGNWIDIDGDGWLDCLIGQSAYPAANLEGQERLYVCLQDTSDHILKDISKPLGLFSTIKEAHTPIPVDYDLDGDQDILVSHTIRDTSKIGDSTVIKTWTQIELLRNEIGNSFNNWASFKLKSTYYATNRSCIGARIYTSTHGLNQIREVQAGVGHFAGQMPFIQNFGVGKYHYIDSVAVRWPRKDLMTSVYKYPPLNCISELNDKGEIVTVKNWEGLKPIIAFDKPFLRFDTVNVGVGIVKDFDVKNLGDSTLVISAISFDSSVASQYSLVEKSFKLDPGKSFTFRIMFSPSKRNDFSTALKIVSNAFNTPTAFIDIQSYGFEKQPMLASDSSSLNFGKVFIDSNKTISFTVKNAGELPLTFTASDINGNVDNAFDLSGNSFPFTLQAGDEKKLNVSFSPKNEKAYTAQAIIKSNAYNEPQKVIALVGAGDIPRAQISIIPGIFLMSSVQIGQNKDKDFQIINTGNGELIVSSITFLSDTVKDIYSIPGLVTPLKVKPTDSTTLTLRFTPKEVKTYNTKMQIASNAINEPNKFITVRGSGVPTSVTELIDGKSNLKITVLPNPVKDRTKLSFELNGIVEMKLRARLVDFLGREVYPQFEVILTNVTYQKEIDLSFVSEGMYCLIIETGGMAKMIPMLVIK